MTVLIASLAYTVVALGVARYLFRKAAAAGAVEADRTAFVVAVALVYSLAWPVLVLGLGAVWFVARSSKARQT